MYLKDVYYTKNGEKGWEQSINLGMKVSDE